MIAFRPLFARICVLVGLLAVAFAALLWAFCGAAPEHGYAWTAAGLALMGLSVLVDERLARLQADGREHFERRLAELPEELAPGECRLLVAVTYDGGTATIQDFAGDDVEAEIDEADTVFVEDLGLRPPAESGLHVWEGSTFRSDAIVNDVGALVDPADVEWVGTWRRATPAEAQRYAAGAPVWGSR